MTVVGSFKDDYTLSRRVLAEGSSSAQVRQAICRRTGKKVAVKVYKKATMGTSTRRLVEAECAALSELSHTNVVQLQAVYESQDLVHVVFEQLGGGEIFDRVSKEGVLPEAEVCTTAAQLLRALAYLHAQGMMHRDVKMENVLYESRGGSKVKLVDFGFAKRFEPGTKVHGRCGSLQYMAPEVLAGLAYDEKADTWSLGCMLYMMLTGKATFAEGSEREAEWKSGRGEIDYCPAFHLLPACCRDLMKGLLNVDPAMRLSAREALAHPWISGGGLCREEDMLEACDGMTSILSLSVESVVANGEVDCTRFSSFLKRFLGYQLTTRMATLCGSSSGKTLSFAS